jgi:apolipoprotein N-acyltransferase
MGISGGDFLGSQTMYTAKFQLQSIHPSITRFLVCFFGGFLLFLSSFFNLPILSLLIWVSFPSKKEGHTVFVASMTCISLGGLLGSTLGVTYFGPYFSLIVSFMGSFCFLLLFIIFSIISKIINSHKMYVILPLFWLLAEKIPEAFIFGPYAVPIMKIAYLQAWPLNSVASIGGVDLVSLWILFVNVALFFIFKIKNKTLGLFILSFCSIFWIVSNIPIIPTKNHLIKIVVLQPEFSQEDFEKSIFDPIKSAFIFERYSSMLLEAAKLNPDAAVLTETAMPWLSLGRDNFKYLQNILFPIKKAYIGTNITIKDNLYNGVIVFNKPKNNFQTVYLKRKIIPIVEKHYNIGHLIHYDSKITNNLRIEFGICWENIFPNRFKQPTDLVIYLSNDIFAHGTSMARIHSSISQYRALENGKPVLYASMSGNSAFYNEYGKLEMPENSSNGLVYYQITPNRRITIYSILGDTGKNILISTLFLCCLLFIKWKHRKPMLVSRPGSSTVSASQPQH